MKIAIEISGCKDCPHLKRTDQWSSDGWDRMEDWICGKANIKIQSCVEWREEKKIEIPEWCPAAVGTEWLLVADELPSKGVDIIGVDSDGKSHECFRCNCANPRCTEWRCSILGYGLIIDVLAYRVVDKSQE